jgi:iron complex outermembrane receptor protein
MVSSLGAASAMALSARAADAQASAAVAPTAPPTLSGSPGASSAPAIAEVVVTARRVSENIQKVPETVTAVSAQQLKQQNINSIYDLVNTAPSLSVATEFNSLLPNYSIRGLATGVATYFAESPGVPAAAGAPFLDIDSVQVLNGPQGTLFGRSSAAGAILITPTHPSLDKESGYLDVVGGDYGRVQLTGVVNIPLIQDTLGLRLAASYDHVDGYTREIGTDQYLDEINNAQFRASLEFRHENFSNFLTINYTNVNQAGTSELLAAWNPDIALYNLPPAYGPAVFGGVCTQAVAAHLSPSAGACVSQRLGLLSTIVSSFNAETARLAAGGSAVRSVPASYNGAPAFEKERYLNIVDVSGLDLSGVGPLEINLKNIFSYQSFNDDAGGPSDGIGGRANFAGAFTTGPLEGYVGNNNEVGNQVSASLGPATSIYNEDLQIHAKTSGGLFNGTAGIFYTYNDIPRDLGGTANIYQIFSGVLNPNLGYNSASGFSDGGFTQEVALYTQETLDVARWIHGLSLTAGYRYSWDDTKFNSLAAVGPDLVTGAYTPGASSQSSTTSNGYNYTFSVSEQITPNWLIYGTIARAYVPGGVNTIAQSGSGLPNYTPTYAPEIVLDKEIGSKLTIRGDGFTAQLGADAYINDFTNIFEQFTGQVGSASVAYNENVAGARLWGVELYGTIIPSKSVEIRFSYNYNNDHYTNWVGQDPFNIAQPGQAICVTASPAGSCYLNLKNNPFPFTPSNQAHVTVVYHIPVDEAVGRIDLSLTGYFQSREYYEAAAARDLQLFPAGLNGVSQAPYATLNLRLDWHNFLNTQIDAALSVNNATDEIYATGKFPQLQTLGFSDVNYAPPRMIAFELSRRF